MRLQDVLTEIEVFLNEEKGLEIKKAEAEVSGKKAVFTFVRPANKPDFDFRVAGISFNGRQKWGFKRDEPDFKGESALVLFENQLALVLTSRNRVVKAIPVSDIITDKVMVDFGGGDTRPLNGMSDEEVVNFKIRYANSSGMKFDLTLTERAIWEARKMKAREERLEARRKEEAERQRREEEAKKERRRRQDEIRSRAPITVYAEDGSPVEGIPVTEDEWRALGDKRSAILVDSYNSENGEFGSPLESFVVRRKARSSWKEKVNIKTGLSATLPEGTKHDEKGTLVIKAKGVLRIDFGGDEGIREVPLFTSENAKLVAATGLNSGTLIAVGNPTTEGRYAVRRLLGDKAEDVGHFAPMEAA